MPIRQRIGPYRRMKMKANCELVGDVQRELVAACRSEAVLAGERRAVFGELEHAMVDYVERSGVAVMRQVEQATIVGIVALDFNCTRSADDGTAPHQAREQPRFQKSA